MNKLVMILSLSISAALLTGCGGGGSSNPGNNASSSGGSSSGGSSSGGSSSGGSSSGGSSSGGSSSGGSSSGGSSSGGSLGITPIVPLNKISYKTTLPGSNQQVETKAGYQGDIVVTKENQDLGGQTYNQLVIKLKDGIPSMNITDLKKTEYISYNCTQPITREGRTVTNGATKTTYDYKTGIVIQSGTGDAAGFGCKSTFRSPLETTVTDAGSLDSLLSTWGNDENRSHASSTGLISTNCPQSETDNSQVDINAQLQQAIDILSKCKIENITNYAITDDQGKTHKVAISGGSLGYGFLLLLAIPAFLRRKLKAV